MIKNLTLVLSLVLCLSGCAAPIMEPPKQAVSIQTLNAKESVAGLSCTLANDHGQWTLITPGTVEVFTSEQDLVVTCVDSASSRGIAKAISRPTPGLMSNPAAAVISPVGMISMADQQLRGITQAYPTTINVFLDQDILVTATE